MGFKIGDRVMVISSFYQTGELFEKGEMGTICDYSSNDGVTWDDIGIRWDVKRPAFHNCCGTTINKHGWYIWFSNHECLRVIDRKKGNIGAFKSRG